MGSVSRVFFIMILQYRVAQGVIGSGGGQGLRGSGLWRNQKP